MSSPFPPSPSTRQWPPEADCSAGTNGSGDTVFWSWHEFFSELTTVGFAHAAWATLWSASVVEAAAVVGGFLLVAVGRSSVGALRLLAGIYVWLWRGTPLLVQL